MVGDAAALISAPESDADRKLFLADDRLIWRCHGHEISEIHGIALCRRTPLANYDRVERDVHRAGDVVAFELRLAKQPAEWDIVGAALGSWAKHGIIGQRTQDDGARACLRLLRGRGREPAATRESKKAEECCAL